MLQLGVGIVYGVLAIVGFWLLAGAADSVGASAEEKRAVFKKIGIFLLVFLFAIPFGEAVAQSSGMENWYIEVIAVLTFIFAIKAGIQDIKEARNTFAFAFAVGMGLGMYTGYQKTNKEEALERRICLLENPTDSAKCEKAPQ